MKNFTKLLNLRSSFLLTALLLLLGSGSDAWAQLTYYSKAASTQFANTASWGVNTDGSGAAPGSISNADNFIIANSSAMTLNASAAVRTLTINSGSLTVAANTLTVALATGNNSNLTVAGGTLNLSGGTITLNGNFLMSSGATNQTGGSMVIDGNNGNASATSVASGTHHFGISGGTPSFSAGSVTVVDPPVNTYTTGTTRAISVALASSVNFFTGTHTFILGDGVSTTPGNTDGFAMETFASSALTLRNVTVNAGNGAGRWATNGYGGSTSWGLFMSGNLTVNANSEFRTLSAANFVVGGNIVNNGTITTQHAPGLTIGVSSSVTGFVATAPQTVSGSGIFQNATTASTALFLNLVFNNSFGITFSNPSQLTLTGLQTGTVQTGLTLTAGQINLGGATFTQGISTATTGTLTWTAGGFNDGSFKKWLGTSTLTTTLPSTTVGNWPFSFSGQNRNFQIAANPLASVAGSITVTHTNSAGLSTVAGTDPSGAFAFDRLSNSSWTVATGDGYTASNFIVNASTEGILQLTSIANEPRLVQSAAAGVGTHVAATGTITVPVANRNALTQAQLNGTAFKVAANNSNIGVYSVQSGNWQDGTTWSKGVAPTATDVVTIFGGHTIAVNTVAAVAGTVNMLGTSIVNVTGSTLSISSPAASGLVYTTGASAQLNISAGTVTIGSTLTTRYAGLQNNGTLAVSGTGTLTVNGYVISAAGSTFSQTAGTITIDQNAGGVVLNSYTAFGGLQLATTNITLTGGTLTIVDPNPNTTITTSCFTYSGASFITCGTGHTFRFGNGVSTDAGGTTTGGFRINPAANLFAFGNLTFDGLNNLATITTASTNRCFTTSQTYSVLGNLTITSGEFITGSSLNIGGNITVAAGATLSSTAALVFQTMVAGVATVNPNAQTVSGSGFFRNLVAAPTANFNGITVRNSNTSGVTFSGTGWNTGTGITGTVSGTLTFTQGVINTSAGVFTLGITAATPGTLVSTLGGFTSGSQFRRWVGTGAIAINAVTGQFPFVANNGTDIRSAFYGQTSAGTGGWIQTQYNEVAGSTGVTISDGVTVTTRSNSNWVTNITGSPLATVTAGLLSFRGDNLLSIANVANVRAVAIAGVGNGTSAAGTGSPTNPQANKTALTTANLASTFYFGNSAVNTTTGTGTDWNTAANWSLGIPTACQDVVINHPIIVATAGMVSGSVQVNLAGSLTINSGDLTVACVGLNNATLSNNGTLTVSGGTLNINGNLAVRSGSTFNQSGGNIIVDGNASGVAANSVASGINIVSIGSAAANFATGTLNLTGGTLTIVDPHTQTTAAAGTADGHAFMYFASNGYTAGLNHTIQMGNGISTDAGGSSNQFDFDAWGGSGIFVTGKFIANAGNGVSRFVTFSFNPSFASDLTVSDGVLSAPVSTANVSVGGNIVNNGTIIASSSGAGALQFAAVTGTTSVVTAVNTIAQSVSGTGVYRNTVPTTAITAAGTLYVVGDVLTVSGGTFTTAARFRVSAVTGGAVTAAYCITPGVYTVAPTYPAATTGGTGSGCTLTITNLIPTANFTNIIVNNNSSTGVTFSDANSLLSGINTGTVSGTLTFTQGFINTGTNAFTLGTSAAAVGTLAYTAGGFANGSTFTRWVGTATGGSTITAAANPTLLTGRFPFISGTIAAQTDRSFHFNQTTAATTGGRISVKYNDAATLSTVSFTDGAYNINRLTDANWVVSQSGITGASAYSLAAVATNLYAASNNNTRLALSGSVVGTHAAGSAVTILPVGQRTAVPLASLANTYYLGADNADLPFVSVASTDWNTPSTWNKNAVPTSTDNVIIANGTTVGVSTAAAAAVITINGILNVGAGANLSVTQPAAAGNIVTTTVTTGQLNISAGTMTVGTGANRFARLTSSGTLSVSGTGTLIVNGNLAIASGSTFNQSGGDIIVDGNAAGVAANSVPTGTNLVAIANTVPAAINLTGGTLNVVDPHAGASTSDYAFWFSAATAVNATTGHTLKFGNGVSTDPGGHTNGFYMFLFPAASYGILGNVLVDNNATSARYRFVTTLSNVGILGNLTINSGGEYRVGSTTYVAGNIVNNGILTSTSTLNFASYASATIAASANAQTVSGSGAFRNSIPTAAVGVGGSGYAVGDVITVLGGTFSSQAQFVVTAVTTGAVTSLISLNYANYSVIPTTPAATSTTGAGSGCTISGFTNFIPTANFGSITVNNSNATGVTLSTGSPLFVSGTLTLTQGLVNTSASNELTLGTTTGLTGTLSGGSATSYIRGPFRRVLASSTTIQANATAPFFPVGNGANYRPAHVSASVNATVGGAIISVESNTAAGGTLGTSVAAPLSADNWDISSSGPATLGNVNIGLTSPTASALVYGIASSATSGGTFELFTLGTFNGTASSTVANLYSNPTSGQPFVGGNFRVATPNTCLGGPTTATVNVNTAAVACVNSASTRTFSAVASPNSVGYTYQWLSSTDPNGVTPAFTPIANYTSAAGATSSASTITVTSTTGLSAGMLVSVTAGVGAFSATATVTAVTSATTFTVSPAPTTALSGGASVVTATATGASYTTPAITAAGSNYYQVSIGCLYGAGTTSSPTPAPGYTAVANPTAVINATPSTGNYCGASGSAVTLVGSGAATTTWSAITGLWTDPSTVAPFAYTALANVGTVYARPASTTTYTLTVTDANSCTGTATQVITLNTPPVISTTTATPSNICVGATSVLGVNVVAPALASNYTFAASSGTYTSITGGTVISDGSVSSLDSYVSPVITIPSFTFAGVAYTTAWMTSNGSINLGGTIPATANYNVISGTTGNGVSLAVFNADLTVASLTTASEMRWQQVGNEVIFQWKNFRRYLETGESFSFQARLNTSTGTVTYVYGGAPTFGSGTLYQPIVGIRTSPSNFNNVRIGTGAATWDSPNAGTLNTHDCRFTTTAPAKTFIDGQTYTFTPPTPPVYTYAWSPGGFIASGGTTASATTTALSSTQAYSVSVSDGICSSTGNTTVTITPLAVAPTATPAPVSQAPSTYTFAASNGTYAPITGGTVLSDGSVTNLDSYVSTVITIPSFTFAGVAYTTAWMTSNGSLNLGGSNPSTTNYNVISGTTGNGVSLAVFNADLYVASLTTSSEMRWQQVGNEIVFQWKDFRRYLESGESFSFQARLNTVTGTVTYVYGGSPTFGSSTSYQPIIGIRTSTTSFKNVTIGSGAETWASPNAGVSNTDACRFTTSAPAKTFVDGQTYTFTPPILVNCSNGLWNLSAGVTGGTPPYTYAWSVPSGVSGLSSTSIANPTVNNVPSNTYNLTVTDGCTPTGSATGSATRTVFTAPALSITSPSLAYCIGTPLALTATSVPALGITWSPGGSLSATSTASGVSTLASPSAAQTYTAITDLDGNGCRTTGTIGPITPAIPPSLASFTANPSAVCIGGNTTLTATPAPGIAYCNPTSGTVNVDNITTVVINTLNKSGLSGQLYTNYPAIGTNTTTLVAGTSYNITVGVQSSGIVSVWFDFNKNGVFESSEWFQPMITGASGTVSVPVPAGAINGPTRMRVRSRSSGSPNAAANFCEATTFFSGNAEDFTVTITGGVTTTFNYTWSETPNSTITPANVNSLVASGLPNTSTYTVIVDDGTCSATQNLVVPVAPLSTAPVVSIPQGASNYEFTPTSGTFTTIVGAPGAVSTPAVIADGYISPAIPLGFSFTFAGVSYSNVYVSSNGFISFNSGAGSNNANNLTSAAAGNYPLLAPLWDDLDGNGGSGSAATYLVTGAPGNQIFTFEWTGWEWFWTSGQNNISFQIKLYEATGKIEFVYSPIINPGGIPSASVGIASAPGNFISLDDLGTNPNIYSFIENNTLNTNPAVGQVYAFTPPVASCPGTNALITAGATAGGAPYTYSWTSVPAGFTSTASAINVKPDVTTTYNVVVTDDCGATTSGTATVTVTPNPMTVTPSLTSVCGNNPVTINFSGAGSYAYFPDYGVTGSTATSITSVAPAGMVPLSVTGFNSDIVANGIGNVTGSTSADVDGSANVYFNDFTFQQGPSDPTQAFGTPTNNLVESFATAGLRYNLAPYTSNNSLRLAVSASGTLNTPSQPIATNLYALVACAGTAGDRTFDATITFTDASTQVFTGLVVKNWLSGTASSAAGFGYVNNTGVQQGTALTPRLFDANLAISVPNQTKQIASVAFTYTGASGIMHVLALTAKTVLPAPSVTYTLFGTASGCEFSRQATINYNTPPALTLASNTLAICEGFPSPANLVTSNPASYNSWVWSTPADVSGNQNTGFIFNPAVSKTLTLNATQTTGLLCNATTTVNVTVNGNPGPGVATVTPSTICQNSNVALTGSGFNPPNTGTLLNETFESGLGSNFAVSGAGITATATGVGFFSSGAVQLGYNNSLTLAGTNNSFELQNDIDLTGNTSAQLLFGHICALEGPSTTYDRGVVQYSIDGGATWVAFPASSYAGGLTLTPAAVANGIVFSTRSNPTWITNFTSSAVVPNNTFYNQETINIPSAALTSNQFRVRFKITSDGTVTYNGWYLDNIRIVATAPVLNYAWSGNGGFTTASSLTVPATLTSAQPTNAGTLTLTATNPAGCTSQAISAPLVVSPTPTVVNQTATICGGSAFTVTPTAPVGTTYTWTAPTYSGALISGGSAQAVGQTSISQTLVNTSGAIRTATYTVTPRIGLCNGTTFTVVVTVYPSLTAPTFPNFNFGGTNDVVLDWIGTPNAVATGVTYTLEIDDAVDFSSPDFGTPTTGIGPLVTTRAQAGLVAGQVYYYRIRSESATCGASPWSTTIPFLTTARVWLGTVSTDWNNALNWGPDNFVPVATDNVIIFNQTNDPVLSTGLNGVSNNLILRDNSITTIGSGKEINVKGNLSSIGAGVTITGPGKINMNGVAAQSITGASIMNNLEINNAAGVSMPSGFVSVRGIVRPVTGTLNALGNLILVSNAAGTGMISGVAPSTGNVIGNVQVNRFMPGVAGYRYISSPITEATGLTTADFDVSLVGVNGLLWNPLFSIPSPFPNCWYYDETQLNTYAQYGWTSATAGAAIQTGRGYALITPPNHSASLVGPVNNGAISATTPMTRTGTQNGAGVNLLGNPYPSPISWNAFRSLNGTSEVAAVVKRFASNSQYYGQYVDWNGTVGTPGSVGDGIALGQAFFITKINAGSLPVNYNNSIRIDNTSTTFYEVEEPQISSLLRMQLIGGAGADEFVLYFDPTATDNYDVNYDAIKFLSETAGIPNIYTNIDSLKVSINVLNALNQDMVIPMGIVAKTAGTYQVNVLEQASFAPTSMLYLEDRTLGIWSDLRTTSQYNVSLPVGEHNGRFFLHFRPAVDVQVADETCQQSDGSVTVTNSSMDQQWNASLLNTAGQVVAQSSGANITFNNLSDGTYTLRLVDANGYSVDELVTVEAGINVSAVIAPLTSSHYYTTDVVEASVQSVVEGATYEWYLNGVLKGTGANISMNVTEAGVYTLTLKMLGSSCVFETNASFSVTQESTVGIETANDASGFIVYPNPVRDVLNVKINDKIGFTTLSIHDAAGRLIHTEVLNGARGEQVIQVQMNDYAAGLYQITLEGNQKRSVAKFSKTK